MRALPLGLLTAIVGLVLVASLQSPRADAGGYVMLDAAVHQPVPATRPSDDTVRMIMKQIRFDELAQVPIVLQLEGDALLNYQQRVALRAHRMEQLETGPLGKLVAQHQQALKAARQKEQPDAKEIARLQRVTERASNEYWTRRSALRLQVLASLSTEQQRYWVQFVLYRSIEPRYGKAELTDQQRDLLWALCSRPAIEIVDQGLLHVDPYLKHIGITVDTLRAQAELKILTDAQREKLGIG